MIKEDFYRDTNIFTKTSSFREARKSHKLFNYLHEGDDFISDQGKKQPIYNLIDGIVFDYGLKRNYGVCITLRHNPKFVGGINESFFSNYCHLGVDSVLQLVGDFVQAGEQIGFMGNTGNCWTKNKITGKYRRVTEKEIADNNSKKGVHLHQEFYQIVEVGYITKLLKQLINLGIVESKDWLWQWSRLYYNPECIMKYFKLLQGRRLNERE